MVEKQTLLEAAQVLDDARDILLRDGLSCYGTGTELKAKFKILGEDGALVEEPVSGSPCLWMAIAEAEGLKWNQWNILARLDDYKKENLLKDLEVDSETISMIREELIADKKTPGWNDFYATEDEVHDYLMDKSKTWREQAGEL